MKAWQFSATKGGLEKHLTFNDSAPYPPSTTLSPEQVLIEVISMSLNPVDYKLPELPLIGRFLIRKPASPGIDYCGRVVSTGSSSSSLSPNQIVFGRLDPPAQFGTMAQYIIAPRAGAAPLPEGISPDHAAAIGTAGLTAYQCIVPNAKPDDRIFINGGSGGTGTFGIQFAKTLGCHVTTTCSTRNVQLCKDLGADDVLDYKTTDIARELQARGQAFALAVDNVGTPPELYKAADGFLKEGAKYVQVGAPVSVGAVLSIVSRMCWPTVLGGGSRAFEMLQVKNELPHFVQIAEWVKEGKVKPVIDSVFELRDGPKAYEKLKEGRARGKIVVRVTDKQ